MHASLSENDGASVDLFSARPAYLLVTSMTGLSLFPHTFSNRGCVA